MDNITETPVSPEPTPTEAERLASMQPNPGVEDGSVVTNRQGEKEKIVYDKDENGEVIGWHKEAVNG